MKATTRLHELARASGSTTSPARCSPTGTLQRLHRRALGHGPDLEPDDLRQGDLRRRRLRRADRRGRGGRRARRGPRRRRRGASSSSWRSPTCATPTKLFAGVHERTARGRRLRASLEVSPLLADDTEATIEQAAALHAKAERHNLFIKIPGTPAGRGRSRSRSSPASRSTSPCSSTTSSTWPRPTPTCAESSGGSRPGSTRTSPSVASIFISRWDVAVAEEVPETSTTGSGSRSAAAPTAPTASCSTPPRWQRLMNEGARPQRLLWASTGTKDPDASDTLYIEAFASPFTVNTMPEPTLKAFADHGKVGDLMPADGGNAEQRPEGVRRGRASTSARWPSACRTRAKKPSTSPGTSC